MPNTLQSEGRDQRPHQTDQPQLSLAVNTDPRAFGVRRIPSRVMSKSMPKRGEREAGRDQHNENLLHHSRA
jgi:hypothetical protein